MSLPLKIAIGTVGSGAIAVGGHEIFAASTGKAGLFISKAPKNSEEGVGGQTTTSGGTTRVQTNEEKITELLKTWENKCVLKIRTASDDQNQELDYSQHTDSLGKLFEELNKFSENNCNNTKNSIRTVIFKETEGEWKEVTDDIANKINEALLKYFQIDEDIVFEVKAKNEDKWIDINDDYLTFKDDESDSKTIEVSFSLSSLDGSHPTVTLNKQKKPKEFKNWKCFITFNKTATTATQLENSETEKLIKSTDNKGFFDKLKINAYKDSGISEQEGTKIRELKKKFIASCGTENKELQDNGATLIQSKTFELKEDTSKQKLIFSKSEEFESWFKEIELTNEENKWADENEDWIKLTAIEGGNKTLNITKDGIASCFIQLSGEINNLETQLKEKIDQNTNSSKTENRKKLLRKCRNNGNVWFIHSSEIEDKINKLFNSQ